MDGSFDSNGYDFKGVDPPSLCFYCLVNQWIVFIFLVAMFRLVVPIDGECEFGHLDGEVWCGI